MVKIDFTSEIPGFKGGVLAYLLDYAALYKSAFPKEIEGDPHFIRGSSYFRNIPISIPEALPSSYRRFIENFLPLDAVIEEYWWVEDPSFENCLALASFLHFGNIDEHLEPSERKRNESERQEVAYRLLKDFAGQFKYDFSDIGRQWITLRFEDKLEKEVFDQAIQKCWDYSVKYGSIMDEVGVNIPKWKKRASRKGALSSEKFFGRGAERKENDN
jgi:hypothetical protein